MLTGFEVSIVMQVEHRGSRAAADNNTVVRHGHLSHITSCPVIYAASSQHKNAT